MKQLVSTGMLLLMVIVAAAQNSNNFQKMVDFLPPAPNAAAIIKHSDIGVNKNTGSPSVNIPLFTVKGTKLAANVSLGYSSTGIKVDEIASRAGMGWVLNAGGVVTRIVRGRADEVSTRITPPSPNPDPNCGTYNFLESAIAPGSLTSGNDAEPDLFNFSMNGISGSFVFNSSMQPVLIPAEKYVVLTDFTTNASWNIKITTTDGVSYYFGGPGATEKTKRNSTCGKSYDQYTPNAWYLIKIEHPNGEYINFSYTPLTYTYETGVSETRHWLNPVTDQRDVPAGGVVTCLSNCTAPPSSSCINIVSTQGVLLSGIVNSSHSVNFTYTTRQDCGDMLLSSVTHYVNGQNAGLFNLTYNQQYANTTYQNVSSTGQQWTPYLTELNESSPDLAFTKTHKFVYNDPGSRPPRLSFSQDHWGYFNGKINSTFIPKPTDLYLQQRFPQATANREVDPDFAGKGLLTKIVYPTGGIDNIDYESNDEPIAIPEYQTLHEYNCSVTGTGTITQVTNSTTFTIDRAQVVELDITSTTSDAVNYDPIHMQGYVNIVGYGGVTILDEPFPAGSPGIQYVRYLNPTAYLAPGTYTVSFSAKGAAQTTTIKLKYYPQSVPLVNKNKIVGGMRVKRVMTGNPGETPVVKRYYYAQDIDHLDVSSLLQVAEPVYNSDWESALACQIQMNGSNSFGAPGNSTINVYCEYTALYSNSITNLFNYGSGAISYSTVIESNGENFEGGASQTKFCAGSDARALVWNGKAMLGAPMSNFSSPLNGLVKEETIYKKPLTGSLFPIKHTQYVYAIDDRLQTKVYGYTVNKKYNIVEPMPTLPCGNGNTAISDRFLNAYDVMRYDINSWWAHPITQNETVYDENGANPVTTSTNMYYDNEQHMQLTRSDKTNSVNQTVKTINTYTGDQTGNAVYDAMKSINMITQLVSARTQNITGAVTSEVALDQINYGNAGNNNFVPVSVQKSVKGNVLETEGTIDQYDAKGNILQYTSKAGVVTSIVWGYNNLYPVAQVVGATYANTIAQLSGGGTAVLQSLDGTALQTELHRIRTGLSAAQVTTYTYKPMAGVTSITDANNKTNTYDYDSFNRLLTVKDQDGNVVKKNDYVYATPNAASALNVFFNQPVIQNINCQTCQYGYTATPVQYYIPYGKYYSLVSQADADAKANADAGGQEYANRNAKCVSTACNAVPPPTCSNCTGNDKKCINNVCETGVRVNVSSVFFKGRWACTYYYRFSDNTTYPAQAPYLTDFSTTPCSTGIE